MNNILTDLYCRLCADLKPVSILTNVVLNTKKRQEITNKLTRLDLNVNFNTMLPKTVCSECMNALELAYDFVKSVELAQEAFEDYDSSAIDSFEVKKDEVPDSDTMDSNNKDNYIVKTEDTVNITKKYDPSIKTEDTAPDDHDNEIGKEFLIEYVSKTNAKLKNVKAKSEKKLSKSKATPLSITRQRKKLKISANVDLDTWLDYNWLCGFCDKYFQSPTELKVHSMQYHNTCNPYRCFDCRARGLHMDKFVMHITRHRPVLTLMCYKCSLKFDTVKELKVHKAIHFDTGYICTGCNTSFCSELELDEHMSRFYKNAEANAFVEDTPNESLTCVLCGKTSKSKITLNRHLLLHTERKRDHVCETCADCFYTRKELIQHKVVHSDARPYKCEVCQYSFKVKAELKKHALIHFGPKRFPCDDCGKCFRLCKELVVHSAVHKDIRPYKCSQCTRSFRFRHLLVQHFRVHTGAKPYACNHCTSTFRNWSNFNKHTKEVHGVDNSKRKRTSEGLYALDPHTKEVIYPDKDKVMEWKKQILGDIKKGRPKKASEVGCKTEVKPVLELGSRESDS